jgi:hypothetical protein
MNEPPGARARVGLTGLTVAEHFRDAEGQDVLLFIDNIFRFTQVISAGHLFCLKMRYSFWSDYLVPRLNIVFMLNLVLIVAFLISGKL